jgi:hypothetical protein
MVLALGLTGVAEAAEGPAVSINVGAAYFWPKDEIFNEVYGGGPGLGAEIGIPVVKRLQAWAGAGRFKKTGAVTFTEEPTTLRIVPVFVGLKYQLPGKVFRPYAGVALAYCMFKENSDLGIVRGNGVGFLGQAGGIITISPSLGLDVHGRFTACRGKPDLPVAVPAEIGGYEFGVGLVIRL